MTVTNPSPFAVPEFQVGDEAVFVVPATGPGGVDLSEHVRLAHRLEALFERPNGTSFTREAEKLEEPSAVPGGISTWVARYQATTTELDRVGVWKVQLRVVGPFGTRYTRPATFRVFYNAGGAAVPPSAPLGIVCDPTGLVLDLPAPTVLES